MQRGWHPKGGLDLRRASPRSIALAPTALLLISAVEFSYASTCPDNNNFGLSSSQGFTSVHSMNYSWCAGVQWEVWQHKNGCQEQGLRSTGYHHHLAESMNPLQLNRRSQALTGSVVEQTTTVADRPPRRRASSTNIRRASSTRNTSTKRARNTRSTSKSADSTVCASNARPLMSTVMMHDLSQMYLLLSKNLHTIFYTAFFILSCHLHQLYDL